MLLALLSPIQQIHLLAQQGDPGNILTLYMILGVGLLFIFMVLRPAAQRRQEQERLNRINSMEKNDRVLTIGGIYGTVVSVSDKENEVLIRVDDNTKLKMTKDSVARNLTKEEKAREAASSAKEAGK
jgi:preprotein translocase subunit YajC